MDKMVKELGVCAVKQELSGIVGLQHSSPLCTLRYPLFLLYFLTNQSKVKAGSEI